jgi:phosphatidate phosphatase PAH1
MSAIITLQDHEVLTVREAMRQMPMLVRNLNEKESEKYVLMKKGRMVAVLLDLEAYSEMAAKVRETDAHPVEHK